MDSLTRPASQATVNGGRRWSAWDIAGILGGCALAALISLRLGRGRVFWEDETLGWMLLRDPSWRHMLAAWNLGADGGGVSFYLTGRLWFALLGASAVTFRMYSAACFAMAFSATWIAARRFYRPIPVAFALFTAWYLSPALVPHIAEGRFYGLLTAAVALAVFLYVFGAESAGSAWSLCLAAFFIHSLLVTSHILGVVYSAFLVLGTFLLDRWRSQWRPLLYLSEVAAWIWLIPSRHAIAASAAVGKPHFWIAQPSLADFLSAYSAFSLRIAALLAVLVGTVAAGWVLSSRRALVVEEARNRRPAHVLIAMFLLVPVAFLVEGFVATPLFFSRYLVPVNIGVAFALAELATLTAGLLYRPSPRLPSGKRLLLAAAALAYAAVVYQYDFRYVGQFLDQQPDYTAALTHQLPRGIPIVCNDAFTFTELMAEQSGSGRDYVYLLDWGPASSPQAPRLAVTQYHLMENWRKAGYFARHIQDRSAFLARTPEFLILDSERLRPAGLGTAAHAVSLTGMMGFPLQDLLASENYRVRIWMDATIGTLHARLFLACRAGAACPSPGSPPED